MNRTRAPCTYRLFTSLCLQDANQRVLKSVENIWFLAPKFENRSVLSIKEEQQQTIENVKSEATKSIIESVAEKPSSIQEKLKDITKEKVEGVVEKVEGVVEKVEDARKVAERILGMQLITHQTTSEGQKVKQVLVEKAFEIEQEFYLGITLDRAQGKNVVMASSEGGVEIEEVAAKNPEKILRETVDPNVGLRSFQAMRLSLGLGLEGAQAREAAKLILRLYDAYLGADCSIAEINPLVTTKGGAVLALDAKINFKNDNFAEVNLKKSEDGISPGQACVFYDQDNKGYKVLGGGWITR